MKVTTGIGLWSMQQMSFRDNRNIEEILAAVKALGVDAVDIYEEYIPCHPHVRLHELNELRKMAEQLELPVKGCWFCLDAAASIEAVGMENTIKDFMEYFAITEALGAEFISIPYLDNIPGKNLTDANKMLIPLFEKILPWAERYHVKIAHELPRVGTPEAALEIHKALQSPYYTLCPDLETWRRATPDLPLVHAENMNARNTVSASVTVFKECLPYSPYIHFKMLGFDDDGNEPHFPMDEIMSAIDESELQHHLCIEYEGWIPDIVPEFDCIGQLRKCVALIERYEDDYAKRRKL